MRPFQELIVWQKAHAVTLAIYGLSMQFPKDEQYGLTSQIRRSSASVPTNIAEGSARETAKEFHQFLAVALGSAAEVNTSCSWPETSATSPKQSRRVWTLSWLKESGCSSP